MKLQGLYGEQKSKKLNDVKIGDVIIWNYGYTSLVVNLIPSKTGKTITAMLKSNTDGNIYERKMSATRFVAVK